MSKNITVYTTNNCAYCTMVKKFLNMKGFSYSEVNVEENPDRRAEAISISGGATTVPVTVVSSGDDKQVMVGYNPGRLSSLLA